ncbi:alkaline shock response membrane anchor protein AmaP [Paenibacillus nicotianae]|uniref:Alkaline shock response membrane anchor protein AmaP n=1 Tax=Paenibacillus nicotianae TaxID=1526551 RepID=A0ABW4UQD9_9BACL
MAKIIDRLLLFIYSLSIGILSVLAILLLSGKVPVELNDRNEQNLYITIVVVAVILFLLSIRFFYLAVRSERGHHHSVHQRTEFGDIQISLETVENMCLKVAERSRGVRDVKTRVRVIESGLEIMIRAIVDGESSIPELTENMQKNVHDQVEEITGIPVSSVSVFIANIVQSPAFKSRVE